MTYGRAAGIGAVGNEGRFVGVTSCFALSGFAALVYQVDWLAQFTLVFGTSELALATVLAAYMGGLAAGAAIAARWVDRVRRPVLVYGFLEGAIAVSALCVPLLLAAAGALYRLMLGDQPEPPDAATLGQPVFYLFVGFFVLALPTGLMGATLPILARHAVREDRQVGPRISLLYAANTAGAVVGTLVAAFVLLPALGLLGTLWCGAAVNVLVFAIAAALARGGTAADPSERRSSRRIAVGFVNGCVAPLFERSKSLAERCGTVFRRQRAWMLVLIMLSGANSFSYEVLWTRMLAHVLGSSVYAFAAMLAAFLAGIALGGGLAGPCARDSERAARGFALAHIGIAALSVAIYHATPALLPESLSAGAMAGIAIAVLLPATLFIGATFPLAVRCVARNEQDAGVATASIYAWNTMGAIAGAVTAGLLIIPSLGFEGAIKLAVTTNLLIALFALVLVAAPSRVWVGAATALTVGVVLLYQPDRPRAVIERGIFANQNSDDLEEIYFSVGRSSTVRVVETDGTYQLRTNGLPEASILIRGSPPVLHPQMWLTALPVVARPDVDSMLIVGYGGGVAVEGVPPSVGAVDVVELEPDVIEANRRLSGIREKDPLSDERVRIIINDARNALTLTRKSYDAIVSQPSHPWTAGASHLFTREFIALAKAHLNPGGVYVHWINAKFVDAALLRSLAATVLDVFEHVRVHRVGDDDLLFLASDGPLDVALRMAETGRPLREEPLHYAFIGINGPEDIIAALMLDESGVREFGSGAPLSTDNRNRMAMQSRFRGDGLTPSELERLVAEYDPLSKADSWIFRDLRDVNFMYVANRLITTGQGERALRLADAVGDPAASSLIAALRYEFNGDRERSLQAAQRALQLDADNAQARYAVVSQALPSFARRDASPSLRAVAAELPVAPLAVIEGWSLGAEQNWAALAALDDRLAAAEVTDLWYPHAVQLRAEWRTKVANDQRHPREALRLVDRAVLIRPDLDLYVLRAAAAAALGEDSVFVESVRRIHVYLNEKLERVRNGTYQMSAGDLRTTLGRIGALSAYLRRLAESGVPRARQVLDRISRLERAFQEFLKGGGYPAVEEGPSR